MAGFMRSHFIVGGILVVMMCQVETALAQMAPRRTFTADRGGNRGGSYYSYDPIIYPDINRTNAAYQATANQSRALQAQSSMARTSAWQNINNSLAQQADMRTQSMLAQRQSAKDWWYDIEARKLAESRAQPSYQPMSLPYSGPVEPAAAVPQKPTVQEIMIWPTLLKSPAFDVLRGKVENPFRRAYADKKPLTADDYRGILQAVDEMKAKLKGMSSQVIESEYEAVLGYLDELSTDAQKRLDARLAPNSETEKKETTESKL
jgi:hypothetical protein